MSGLLPIASYNQSVMQNEPIHPDKSIFSLKASLISASATYGIASSLGMKGRLGGRLAILASLFAGVYFGFIGAKKPTEQDLSTKVKKDWTDNLFTFLKIVAVIGVIYSIANRGKGTAIPQVRYPDPRPTLKPYIIPHGHPPLWKF